MRLYLSSYGLGKATSELQRLVGIGNNRAAVINNACDFREARIREERNQREFADLASLGFEPEEIDLREYFDGSFSEVQLASFDLVWIRGGNVFNLMRAMKQSGFDKAITRMLQYDKIVYGGYSAGACALAPTLHGIELCDPVDDIPEGYPSEIVWDGLGILPYEIVPHYKSDHPESGMIDDVVEYVKWHNIPYETLSDGEVIVVDGDKTEKLT